jgi:hypothetical protein
MLALLMMFAPYGEAFACSCPPPDRARAFDNADEVVGGEIMGTESNGAHSFSVFKVGKRWKGGGNTNALLLRADGPCG